MKKGMILPIIGAIAAGALGIFEIIPSFFAILVILVIIFLRDFILMYLMRGLPYAMMMQRMSGGIMFGIWNKQNNIKMDRFTPIAGVVQTAAHGLFNLMPERIYKMDGIPFAIAPANVGYNVGFDHALLVSELEKRGISQITDIADVDEYGQVLNFKDSPLVADLKDKFDLNPTIGKPLELGGMNAFYRYTKEASNPYHQDARVKIGISQGVTNPPHGTNWGLYIMLCVFALCGVIALSLILNQNAPVETVVRVVQDNLVPTIIPG